MISISNYAHTFSHAAHAGQFRKDGFTRYTVHTDYVGDNANRFYEDFWEQTLYKDKEILKTVGYLHDVIEDTDVTESQLRSLPIHNDWQVEWQRAIDAVVLLTRPSKSVHIINYLNGIKQNKFAKAVKLADLEHNMSDLGYGNLLDKYQLCREFLLA